jgi:hypothetical protein
MKRFMTRGAPGLFALVAVGLLLAACAPTGGGGGGAAPTTSMPGGGGPAACTKGGTNTVTLGGGNVVHVPVGWPHADANLIDVCWNFGTFAAGTTHAAYLDECKKDPADPLFNVFSDCSGVNEWNINPNANPGSGHVLFDFFRGANPDGSLWGIFHLGDSTAGIPATGQYTQGWLRVTLDTPSNNGQAISVPFTFAA